MSVQTVSVDPAQSRAGIQLIPLNKLVVSPRNVRRKDAKADIESLAASISSLGLLHNLCVVARDDGRFEVEAGGRRRLALKHLVKTGVIANDHLVPCEVVDVEKGREVSLAENVHRVAMDAIDEADAYAALIAQGGTPESVSHRFGVTRRHVDQRLALAKLSPQIKSAWKKCDITLEAARAFCLVDDHAQQNAVLRSLSRPVDDAELVRARLVDGRIPVTDRMAVFVGLESYVAAGGSICEDLFEPEASFIDNPSLLTRLAEAKLEVAAPFYLSQGWGWVEVQLGANRIEGLSATRVHEGWREPTPDEQAELDRLASKIEALDSDLEDNSVPDDPRWSQRDDLEAAFETIRQTARMWDPEIKKLGGVVLSLDRTGTVHVSEGLVRISDERALKAVRAASHKMERDDHEAGMAPVDHPSAQARELPKALNRDLTLVRTRALRHLIAGDPDTALALCVAALASTGLQRGMIDGVAISGRYKAVDDFDSYEAARGKLAESLPEDSDAVMDWAVDQSRERLLGVLAVMVAGTLDFTHEDASGMDRGKKRLGDVLARQLDLDMTAFWSADLAFWTRLSKASLLTALEDAPGMAEKGKGARAAIIKAHAKLRRDELAAKVCALYAGSGYLPSILTTPFGEGDRLVTPAGVDAMAGSLQAAE